MKRHRSPNHCAPTAPSSNPESRIPDPQVSLPALADSAERAVLSYLVVHCSNPDTSPELFCKLAHVFCEIKKENNVRDKTAAMLELAKARRRPARGPDGRSCENPFSHPTNDPAPYGRKSDGSPYTSDEFHSALDAAVADLYGLCAPDENRPAPLGSPDDTADPDPKSATPNPQSGTLPFGSRLRDPAACPSPPASPTAPPWTTSSS